jgi:DNA-directed RNA polymerase subunit RPC12/RpoP
MPEVKKRRSEDITCAACGAALHVAAGTQDTAVIRCEICQSTVGTWANAKIDARKRREDSCLRVARSR